MDEAFTWAEKAVEERDFYLQGLPRMMATDPAAAADPRAVDIVRRMGLSPPPRAGGTAPRP
jgi:hypothetical protein